MGFGKGAPSAPSASETASAQQSASLINQYNPFGSSTYTQTGTGPTGVPTYRQDVSVSPQVQAALNASLGSQTNVANAAQSLSQNIGSQLGKPLDFSQQQAFLNDVTAQNLDRSWDRQYEQNETNLVNRGIRPGSTAYQQATTDFRNDRSNAYNSANAANYNTALQSQLALRNQPLAELSALMSGGQPQLPQFGATPGVDVIGATNNAFNQQMAGYNSQQAQFGGLLSAGASLIPLLSDRRAKTDIRKVGTLDNGLDVFLYRYKHGGGYQIGLMAQDVEKVRPEAVVEGPDGFKRVNYEQAVA